MNKDIYSLIVKRCKPFKKKVINMVSITPEGIKSSYHIVSNDKKNTTIKKD